MAKHWSSIRIHVKGQGLVQRLWLDPGLWAGRAQGSRGRIGLQPHTAMPHTAIAGLG